VAHVLEHMMFKGTRSVGTGRVLTAVWPRPEGRDNAFTSRGLTPDTSSWYRVPQLPAMMALEADRMANLQLSDQRSLQFRDQGGDGRAAHAHRG
jgi:zinc protease